MLDTSVIYPFLFAVVSVAVVGVAIAVGLLISEGRANGRRTKLAREVDRTAAVTGPAVDWNLNTDHGPRS